MSERLLTDEEMMKALNRKDKPESVYWIPARKIAEAQRDLTRKETFKEVGEWLDRFNGSRWGGFSGDIPPLIWEAFKRGEMQRR